MDKDKFTQKLKEGVSIQQIESFVKTHTMPLFGAFSIFVGAISSIFDFFTGASLTIFFLALGTIIALMIPVPTEKSLKQIFHFCNKQEKTIQIVLGVVKIALSLFVPFLFFGFLGLLAGCSYHYYIRHSQIVEENKHR